MSKRAFAILMSVMLGLAVVPGPALCALAQEASRAEINRIAAKDAEASGGKGTERGEDAGASSSQDADDKKTAGSGIGQELYHKVDEALDGVDQASLRKNIREALHEMDEKGISPTAIAENLFGIGPGTGAEQEGAGTGSGSALLEDAQKTIQKSTEGFFSKLWDGFLDTLGSAVETGLGAFAGKGGSKK